MNKRLLWLWLIVVMMIGLIGCPWPGPDPDPDPHPAGDLRVLITYEAKDLHEYPFEQVEILGSAKVINYLNENCDDEGNRKKWLMLDNDNAYSRLNVEWHDDFKEAQEHDGMWLIATTDKKRVSVPLPENIDEFIATLDELQGR